MIPHFSDKKISDLEEYKSFSDEIDYLADFFQSLSDLFYGRIISFITNEKVQYLDTSLIENSAKTLRSVNLCCSIGSFSDANTLLRRFRDDLLLYIYILDVTNKRKLFFEDDLATTRRILPETCRKENTGAS